MVLGISDFRCAFFQLDLHHDRFLREGLERSPEFIDAGMVSDDVADDGMVYRRPRSAWTDRNDACDVSTKCSDDECSTVGDRCNDSLLATYARGRTSHCFDRLGNLGSWEGIQDEYVAK